MSGAAPAAQQLRAVARGTAVTLAGAVASTAASFGLVLLVTRSVAADEAGAFFAATSTFVVGLAVAGLGTDAGLARFVLRLGPDRGADVVALLKVAAVPVAVSAVGIALVLALASPQTRALAWALPLAAAADFCLAATRAWAVFGPTALIDRLLRPALQVVLVTAALALGGGTTSVAIGWAAAYGVAAVLAVHALRAVTPPAVGRASGAAPAREFWRFTWPRAIARIAQVVIQKADVVLVALLLSPAHAAVYTVATRFVVFGQLANQAVSTVVQPRFTAILHEGDRPALDRVFTVSTCWSVLLAWPVYVVVAAAPTGYLGWFGGGYTGREAATVVVTMALSMLVAVASGPVDTLLLMSGRSAASLVNTLVAVAVDIGLCLLLVPRLGIAGAAVAWGAAVTLRCVLGMVQVRRDVRPDLPSVLLAGAVPVVCMGVPLVAAHLAFGLGPTGWLVAAALCAVGYAAAVWRLRRPLAVDVFLAGARPRRPALQEVRA